MPLDPAPVSRSHRPAGIQQGNIISKDITKGRGRSDIASFVSKARAIRTISQRQARLLFALDATASREASWSAARRLHRELYDAAADTTGIAIQLCYYRGFDQFTASNWLTTGDELRAHMDAVSCLGGPTQIGRLLSHYLEAGTAATPVRGLVFIGDAVEESPDLLLQLAGQCRLKRQPVFAFQEGSDPHAGKILAEIARVSGGAYAAFDGQSADLLRSLLGAVARYASGGRKALTRSNTEGDKLLLSQLAD